MGREGPLFWQSGHPACCSMVEGKQKSRRAEESDSNILLVQQGSRVPPVPLGRTKEICSGLEYKPCLESGNAPEGTSRNV